MRFCWDNIENIRLTKNGNFRDKVKKKTYFFKKCKNCGDEFLGENQKSIYCCKSCSNNDRTFSDETKQKIRESRKRYIGKNSYWYGKHLTEEHRINISKSKGGRGIKDWNIIYKKHNIPTYNTYAPQLEWCEEVRRNEQDPNMLEVRCSKCNEWFVPKLSSVSNRIQYLKENYESEGRFYCSEQCKDTCYIYRKSINTIMKEDAVRAGRLPWLELKREIQPELRQIVLERDNNECVKCGETSDLQCHHIFPVNIEPLLSTDIDNCITLCIDCHKEAHKKDGCRYNQLHIEEC